MDGAGESTGRAAPRLAEVMGELARGLRHEHQPVETTLEAITAGALQAVPGADAAGISFVAGRSHIEARAATGDRPRLLDELQNRLGQGPCLRAIREQDVVLIPDMTTERRWPRFAAAAVEHGVGSMLSLRLFVTPDRKLGALNLYAEQVSAFNEESVEVGRIYAVHAAIALAAAERENRLEAALRSRDRIGQAKGILMERYRITSDQAFALLVRSSSLTNRRIRDIAEEIATSGEVPAS